MITIKKILFLSLLLIMAAVPSIAQQHNRIAIYVPEENASGVDPETKAYAIGEFTKLIRQDGKYIVVNRSAEFHKAIDSEGAYQESSLVNDQDLTRFGNESGVDYVCAIVFRKVLGQINIETQLIDVAKGYVIASDNRILNSSLSLKTLNNEINAISGVLTGALGEKGTMLRSANERLTYSNGEVFGYMGGNVEKINREEVRIKLFQNPEALRLYDNGAKLLYDKSEDIIYWVICGTMLSGLSILISGVGFSFNTGSIIVSTALSTPLLYGLSIPIIQMPIGRKKISKAIDLYNGDVLSK
jgi:TolB-like protein